jgi:hypothetical protein
MEMMRNPRLQKLLHSVEVENNRPTVFKNLILFCLPNQVLAAYIGWDMILPVHTHHEHPCNIKSILLDVPMKAYPLDEPFAGVITYDNKVEYRGSIKHHDLFGFLRCGESEMCTNYHVIGKGSDVLLTEDSTVTSSEVKMLYSICRTFIPTMTVGNLSKLLNWIQTNGVDASCVHLESFLQYFGAIFPASLDCDDLAAMTNLRCPTLLASNLISILKEHNVYDDEEACDVSDHE